MCAGAMVHVRLARVVYGAGDPKAGAAGGALNLLQFPTLNHQCQITRGVREAECRALLQQFFAGRNKGKGKPAPRSLDQLTAINDTFSFCSLRAIALRAGIQGRFAVDQELIVMMAVAQRDLPRPGTVHWRFSGRAAGSQSLKSPTSVTLFGVGRHADKVDRFDRFPERIMSARAARAKMRMRHRHILK